MADTSTVTTHGTATTVGAIFKEVYGEKIAEQTNRTAWIYNFFDKSTRRFGGKYWTVPAHFEGGQSIGSFDENESMNGTQSEVVKEMQIKPKLHYALIMITGLAMAASKSNLHAFVSAKDLEVKNKTKWLISMLNANFYQQGKGVLGTVLSYSNPTITVNRADSRTKPTNMNWFRVGMRIDVFTSISDFSARLNYSTNVTAKGKGWKITTVNKAAGTIGLAIENGDALTASVAVGNVICYEDAMIAPADSYGKHVTGLDMLVDDGTNGPVTVQNISRTTYPDFKSTVLANAGTGRALSLDLMQQGIDAAEVASGAVADFMIMGFGQRRNYLNLLWYDVRYGPQKLAGGFDVLKYNNLDVVVDKDCTDGRIYMGSQNSLKKYVVQPLGVLDQTGEFERVTKKDTYEMMLGAYMNLGIEQPNSWTQIADLIEP